MIPYATILTKAHRPIDYYTPTEVEIGVSVSVFSDYKDMW